MVFEISSSNPCSFAVVTISAFFIALTAEGDGNSTGIFSFTSLSDEPVSPPKILEKKPLFSVLLSSLIISSKKAYRIRLDSKLSKSFFCFFVNFTLSKRSGLLSMVRCNEDKIFQSLIFS